MLKGEVFWAGAVTPFGGVYPRGPSDGVCVHPFARPRPSQPQRMPGSIVCQAYLAALAGPCTDGLQREETWARDATFPLPAALVAEV